MAVRGDGSLGTGGSISRGSCALAAKTRPSKRAAKNTGESRVREVPLNVSLMKFENRNRTHFLPASLFKCLSFSLYFARANLPQCRGAAQANVAVGIIALKLLKCAHHMFHRGVEGTVEAIRRKSRFRTLRSILRVLFQRANQIGLRLPRARLDLHRARAHRPAFLARLCPSRRRVRIPAPSCALRGSDPFALRRAGRAVRPNRSLGSAMPPDNPAAPQNLFDRRSRPHTSRRAEGQGHPRCRKAPEALLCERGPPMLQVSHPPWASN